MAECLIALGSNLGDRAEHLRRAVALIDAAPGVRLVARSAWHQTPPIGGPAGQRSFLNGAVLVATTLPPRELLGQLLRIEQHLGRLRQRRWEARSVDLDVLLYDRLTWQSAELSIPHPRMHYRRFVLAPAVEAAPAMVHPASAWTVSRLLDQLDRGANVAAVAAADPHLGAWLIEQLSPRIVSASMDAPRLEPWRGAPAHAIRPKLILAAPCSTGGDERQWRKILQLPATGPVAWLPTGPSEDALSEAAAAITSVWPQLAPTNENA
jgi:2-amino-4-hydroxy-6-hydroxymethyldihydropteridine diphosphokinase